MTGKKLSPQERLIEIGKALGGIFAVAFASMDARVRPYVIEVIEWAESNGIRGARLVRQLVDRHLVASLMRPLLIGSTLVVTVAYGLGCRWLYGFGIDGFGDLGEVGWWLGGVALLATLIPVVLIGLVWRVRGLRDAGIRTLRQRIAVAELAPAATAAGELRQTIDGQIDQVNASLAMAGHSPLMIDTLDTTLHTLQDLAGDASAAERRLQAGELEVSSTFINEMDGRIGAALQGVAAHRATPAVQQDAAAQFAGTAFQHQLNTLRTALRAMRTQVEQARPRITPQLRLRVLRDFGRPGYAPRIAFTLIAQWVIAGGWFIALAVVLQTWHRGEMIHAHVDPRWTSGLILMGGVLLFGAVGWLMFAITIAQVALKYGLRMLLWAVRLVAKPTVEIFDFDDEDDEINVAKDLGLPVEEWSKALGLVLGLPVGVLSGLLMLLATRHTLTSMALIAMDAFVLLCGYLFLVKMAGIRNEWIYRGVIIGHFVWAVAQFILWIVQPTWSDAVGAGAMAFLFANIVTPAFVAILVVVAVAAGVLATRTSGTPARLLFVVALLFGIVSGGMMLARTVYADAPSATHAASAAGEDDGFDLGDLVPELTVNAGSHDASQGHSCSTSDPSRPCR